MYRVSSVANGKKEEKTLDERLLRMHRHQRPTILNQGQLHATFQDTYNLGLERLEGGEKCVCRCGRVTAVVSGSEERFSEVTNPIITLLSFLLLIEHIHERGRDELHDRVHDALLFLLVAAAGGHRLLGAGEAALGGLLHRGRRLGFLLLLLLDAVLRKGIQEGEAGHGVNTVHVFREELIG